MTDLSTYFDRVEEAASFLRGRIGDPPRIAIVLGSEPAVPLTSVSKIPYDMDEVAVAGGLRGEPVEVVRCETNDLLVPANAELVIEGFVPAGVREHEGPLASSPVTWESPVILM